jgi:hypothetical protein
MSASASPPESTPAATDFDIATALRAMEQQLSAPQDSLINLVSHDDWSFIIKAHALIEAAVTFALTSVIDERLGRIFAMLELGKSETGKLEFAKALGLLSSEQRGFIRVLSKLRNTLAHDARYLNFTLDEHIASLQKEQRKAFYVSMLAGIPPDKQEGWLELITRAPKAGLIRAVLHVVTSATRAGTSALLDKSRTELALRALDYVTELRADEADGS